MGYTHYWYRPKVIAGKVFQRITEDFSKVVPVLQEIGVALAGEFRQGDPIIHKEEVAFNGVQNADKDESYEPFHFPRILDSFQTEKGCFDCCKTARRPYDLAVTAFLIIAKHHLNGKILVKSDGDDGDWEQAKILCQVTLGYGIGFQLTRAMGLVERVVK